MEITRKMSDNAFNLIDEWKACDLDTKAKSNLVRSKELRIDNQGQVDHIFVNLQIQMNCARTPGKSTTLAQIIVPTDTQPNVLRNAFKMSLNCRAKLKMVIKETLNK